MVMDPGEKKARRYALGKQALLDAKKRGLSNECAQKFGAVDSAGAV